MILVTGGAGLIGSHVVDLLVEQGHAVRVLDSLEEPTHQGPPDWLRPDVEYIFGDVRGAFFPDVALKGVDTLIHLAAHTGFEPGAMRYFDVNVTGLANLLDRATSLKRLIVASTQGVYGEPGGKPIDESVVTPRTPYAVSKLCSETLAFRLGPSATTALRFGLTYGPRQSASNPYCGIVSLFSQRMRRGRPVLVYEDGQQTRDLIHVSDVARAVVQVLDDDRTHGQVFNVSTGEGTTVLEVVRVLADLWGVQPEVFMPGWSRPGDMRHLVVDSSRLQALGWAPTVSLREGLASYVDWARARPLGGDPFDEALRNMRSAGLVRS